MKEVAIGYLLLVIVMSALAFVAYGIDKHQARAKGRRISERLLQRLALLGGWPGAWLGQSFFRHKTQKRSFKLTYWSIVALHLGLIGGALYFWIRNR